MAKYITEAILDSVKMNFDGAISIKVNGTAGFTIMKDQFQCSKVKTNYLIALSSVENASAILIESNFEYIVTKKYKDLLLIGLKKQKKLRLTMDDKHCIQAIEVIA